MPTLWVPEHRIMDLDAVLLARLPFAFTIMFHIIFPTFTIGLSIVLSYQFGTNWSRFGAAGRELSLRRETVGRWPRRTWPRRR